MSNKSRHHLNFFNYMHTDSHHLWQGRTNINTTLQLHFGDIMNKQWFTAAAFITQTWLKRQTPKAYGGLMIPLCLLLFTSTEGTPLSSSPGCLLAPNEASLLTSHSPTLRPYSAPSHGEWKRLGSPDARVYPWRRWVYSVCCIMMLTSTCVCVTSWHMLAGIHRWLLNCPLWMQYSAPSVHSPARDRQCTYLHNVLMQ